ncbi:MAG: flagellar filament capping protein FliD [Colwellia sp.]|nr:flagellar filament capping protein FliD [Colwellia sp.]
MAIVTSLGIGSGIDLESLVEAYVNAEAIPQEIRLQEKEDRLSLELSGVGSFKSSLSSFNDILKRLTDADAFNKQVVTSSSDAIDVKSNGFASNGDFEITVEQLAKGSRYNTDTVTDSSSTVGNGTVTFSSGSETFDVVIEASDTLSQIRDKINEQSENFGVTANIINGENGSFLVIDSQITGEDNELSISVSDASLDKLSSSNPSVTRVQDAQDASITIGTTVVTSETNEFKNTIEDLTITVKEKTIVGSPTLISVAQDTENGSSLIDDFIAGYNGLMEDLTGLAAPKQGRLAFDPNVRQMKQQMANIVLQTISTAVGGIENLHDIGLELNRDGKLQISTFTSDNIPSGQNRLDDALSNNLSNVGELFASSGGIATQMSELIDNYIASDGVLTQRVKTLTERVSDIDDEWSTLEERLRSLEERLRNQFTYLDTTVSQYNATSEWLTSSLKNIGFQNND